MLECISEPIQSDPIFNSIRKKLLTKKKIKKKEEEEEEKDHAKLTHNISMISS